MAAPHVARFLDDCRRAVGESHVVTDPDLVAGQTVDWTRRWHGSTVGVVRPGSVDEVAAVVAAARRHRVAVVPQGGNTSLVGGATPLAGEAVIDLRRLDHLGAVDRGASQVTVGAGVTLAALESHAAGAGLAFGVDLAARDSATVGGMVATNAGGLHVLRHGSMRRQVVGVEAVLGTGEVVAINMAGLEKDNTGYDLAGLLCGSEGTLGIVTAARLRLVPALPTRLVAHLGFASAAHAVAALPVLRSLPGLNAVEVMFATGLAVVAEHLAAPPPVDTPCVVLVELAGPDGSRDDDLVGQLSGALDALGGTVTATAVADDARGAAGLWQWRDAHTEALSTLGVVHKADVTIPTSALAAFVADLPYRVAAVAPGVTQAVFGHLADGNLHVAVVGPAAGDDRAVDAVLALTLELGGSVSAEHGIGVAKRAWLVRQRGEAQVRAMRAVKESLDPDGILNPGVLLPPADQAPAAEQ